MTYPNPDILVSPQWLMEHKDDQSMVIVDCPWAADVYTKAHIPGALSAGLVSAISRQMTKMGI